MMKRLIVLVLLASTLLTGCNTARGFGEDIKHLGAKGNTLLRLNVYDRQAQVSLNLFSKSYKVSLTQGLVSFFEDNDIKYTVI